VTNGELKDHHVAVESVLVAVMRRKNDSRGGEDAPVDLQQHCHDHGAVITCSHGVTEAILHRVDPTPLPLPPPAYGRQRGGGGEGVEEDPVCV
jgi:hypothetical protein